MSQPAQQWRGLGEKRVLQKVRQRGASCLPGTDRDIGNHFLLSEVVFNFIGFLHGARYH